MQSSLKKGDSAIKVNVEKEGSLLTSFFIFTLRALRDLLFLCVPKRLNPQFDLEIGAHLCTCAVCLVIRFCIIG